MNFKLLLLVPSVMIVLMACDSKPKCAVPTGTYVMKMKSISGSCPAKIVAQFEGMSDTVEVLPEQECKRFLTKVGGEIPEPKCDLTTDISAEANENGLSDGQAVFNMKCEDGFVCRQTFSVVLTHQNKK